jgi:hypothetical protein
MIVTAAGMAMIMNNPDVRRGFLTGALRHFAITYEIPREHIPNREAVLRSIAKRIAEMK